MLFRFSYCTVIGPKDVSINVAVACPRFPPAVAVTVTLSPAVSVKRNVAIPLLSVVTLSGVVAFTVALPVIDQTNCTFASG